MNKIAVCMIVKDDSEVSILQRALNSLGKGNVDAVYITGTKEPQKKLKQFCKEHGLNYSFFPWCNDFSAARNFNFEQVPAEYDWIFWMDTDDVVKGADNFQNAIELAEKNNIKAIFARYLYQVELDKDGNVKNILIEHLRERLIKNDGTFHWVAPIHETLIEKVPSGKTDYQGFMVVHLVTDQDMEKSVWRNIEILEQNVIDNPEDPRPIYYLAKAYYDTKLPEVVYDSCGVGLGSITLELLKDYLVKSGWAEERSQAWEYVSQVHRDMGHMKEAIEALMEAMIEDPKFISIYVQLALCYVQMKDWNKALHWIKVAGNVDMPQTTLVIQPRDYKAMLLEALFHVYLNTGQLDKCEQAAQGLYKLVGGEVMEKRLEDVKELKKRNDIAHWIVKMAYHLKETKQSEQLKNLVNSIPTEIAEEPVMINLRNEFTPAKIWGENDVAIYCGPGWEKWSPKSAGRGIGGSEEAVIRMSAELVKLGWNVTVFGDPQDEVGIYQGVNYLPYYYFNSKDTFNILVSWRQIGLFDIPNLKFKKSYLWNHDLQNDLTYTPERIEKINKVMFLSRFHRTNVPKLSDDKVMITANGI